MHSIKTTFLQLLDCLQAVSLCLKVGALLKCINCFVDLDQCGGGKEAVVIHCKCCNNSLSQTQATASPVQQMTHITNKPYFLFPVKHMLEQPWGLAVRK
jgi:hypothetical protein